MKFIASTHPRFGHRSAPASLL